MTLATPLRARIPRAPPSPIAREERIRATLPNNAPVAAPLEDPSEGNRNIEAWILQTFGARLPIIAHVARLESRKFTPAANALKVARSKVLSSRRRSVPVASNALLPARAKQRCHRQPFA
jgi:hypothetical protein